MLARGSANLVFKVDWICENGDNLSHLVGVSAVDESDKSVFVEGAMQLKEGMQGVTRKYVKVQINTHTLLVHHGGSGSRLKTF